MEFGSWTVNESGIYHTEKPAYDIPRDQLTACDWVEHMADKRWVNMVDFRKAFEYAKGANK